MRIINKIFTFLGYTRCRVCHKWCKPSTILGDLCSSKCLGKENEKNNNNKNL